jgi:tetratricopeptide (TPR) repeat protein
MKRNSRVLLPAARGEGARTADEGSVARPLTRPLATLSPLTRGEGLSIMLLVMLLLLLALPAVAAPEKWWEAYNRGVKAVNAKQYDVAVQALQAAIAEMPAENTAARTRKEIITYVPHFWLGIARFSLNDFDGAMREWKISEEQGAIAKTEYYSRLRDYVAQAQAAKVRQAQNAASGARKEADAALSRALSGQMGAVSAGGDRSETYRAANRKLQEAMTQFNAAGTSIDAYTKAAQTATQARDLFAKSTEDAKKLRASRPPAVAARPTPQQQVAAAAVTPSPVLTTTQIPEPTKAVIVEPPAPIPEPEPVVPEPVAPTIQAPVESESRKVILASPRPQLESAYRAFAAGDLESSERVLSAILVSAPSGEAYLLRGCTRYTRALLSRNEALVADATTDFKTALKLKRSLRLDKRLFSPKLVTFFDQVRKTL